jgi:hypothetical protein
VHVRIDNAWQDVQAGGVDDGVGSARMARSEDGDHVAVLDEDVHLAD